MAAFGIRRVEPVPSVEHGNDPTFYNHSHRVSWRRGLDPREDFYGMIWRRDRKGACRCRGCGHHSFCCHWVAWATLNIAGIVRVRRRGRISVHCEVRHTT